jgi:hypothetical protein
MNVTRRPAGLRGNLGFLLLDDMASRLVAIEASQDLHRNAPVRRAGAILKDDIEQDCTLLLRDRFHTFRHGAQLNRPSQQR